jgi:hypothetical protein
VIRTPAPRRLALAALFILTPLLPPCRADDSVAAAGSGADRFTLEIRPERVEPGGLLKVSITGPAAAAEGRLGDQELIFHATDGQPPFSLAGIDLETPPGPLPLTVFVRPPDGGGVMIRDTVRVIEREFDVQRLEIEEKPYTPERLERIARERERLKTLWETTTPARLWETDFAPPLRRMHVTSAFGLRRFINGTPRKPHTGIDLRAAAGDTIFATNGGRVVLSDDLFFSGNTVILDHGEGLYSMYFHLSRPLAAVGDELVRGQPLGLAGSTGRATGPHLHWGLVLRGARLDPLKILELAIRSGP